METNSTITWPKPLTNIIGAADDAANWNPIVKDLMPGQGVLQLGSVLSLDVSGKMKLTDATTYAAVYGILLETVDTGTDALSTDEFPGQVARQGSFKATELVMAAGADITQCADALRKNGIYLEGAANFVNA
jgi:hypothetical protein